MFHLEKLKDSSCAHEYVVTVSNWFEVLDALEDQVEFWDTFKHKTLEAAKECIGEPETLDSTEKSCAARLARYHDQYRALSHRIRILLRRDKKKYVRSLAVDVEGHLNVNDSQPAYRALKKFCSKSTSRVSAISGWLSHVRCRWTDDSLD